MYKNLICDEFRKSLYVSESFFNKEKNFQYINNAVKLISHSFKNGGKVISCGNGGSHCDAMHFSEELIGRYRDRRASYPALVISDPSCITCIGNDFGYEFVFSRYIQAVGNCNDILVCFSTSGNSINIIKAIEIARLKNMKVISFTGNMGGKIADLSDIDFCVPYCGYSDRIQEVHIKIIHILVLLIEKEMMK
ncbi:Phosphoheptose isomerase [Candidatus Westeberhardia cardiocondylae]|uniref:Phosphoheptose isomerase n=1 Tax=Candidatus Westeberhardia cardiocondylae TaxID=1594731 RepID=A0A0H5BWM9_9ENTR|nr:D-sedoheptulose 7-phosphate isomerase [Candidatus Westeberhardia cardiocondylae]MCR3756464.1 D-sedoheptulose 7-phosphate isomerase [Candidatus Westeberhardia cardiocondylae]CEN32014.1 Phosphoheptose isomerase [Candidatus Westeberhardia cardiocondylae]